MKKIFAIIALAALTLVACEKVEQIETPADNVTTIRAIAGAGQTKTTVDGFDVKWSAGDKLAVADEDNTAVEFTLASGENTDTGLFNGSLGGKALGTYAVYPYRSVAIDATSVTTEYLASWDYGTTEVPMWGANNNGSYVFENIGGAVLVTYTNVPATPKGKTFVLTSNNVITGPVTVTGLPSTPVAAMTSTATGMTVTINNVPGDETSLSFVVPVIAESGYNFTVALKDGDNVIPGTSKTASDIKITPNVITRFPVVNLTPVIKVSTANPMTVASTASSQTITYSISNVADTEVVSAATTTSWISNVTVVDGTTVTFDVAQQPQGGAARSGFITLSYSGATDLLVTVDQDPAPVINLSTTTPLYVKETGEGSQSVSYTISYPTAGSELTAAESLDWVTTPIVGDDEVTFTVSDQTHGDNARYGIITLNYPNANPVSFYVSQEGKVYTLSGTTNSKTQNDINGNGIAWDGDFEINTDEDINWRLHRGNSNTETKTIYCQSGIPFRVTTIEHTSTNGNKVNSISLNIKVGDTAGSGNAISDHTGNIPGTYIATIPTTSPETIWYNKYYTFEYNITFGNKNGYEIFNSAVFYGYIVP